MSNFEDWLAVCNVKARYCRLLDTKDWDGWGQLFAENAILDVTGSGGTITEGRAAIVESVRLAIDAAVTAHQVHSPEIEIMGDEATGIWAMQDVLTWPDGRKLIGFGHYHERYKRGSDGWQIAQQALTRLSMEMVQPD